MLGTSALDKKWRTENDLRTLRDAGELKQSPGRMKAVKALAIKEAKALAKISKKAPGRKAPAKRRK